MKKKIAIGYQQYNELISNNLFYVDKTDFIREWWEKGDKVTLITRPRRFGKTLTMSMTEQFFSAEYAGRWDLFEGTDIWEEEKYHKLQGSFPVIALSFADIKETSFVQARKKIGESIVDLYNRFDFLAEGDTLNPREKDYFNRVASDMEDYEITISIRRLSGYLYKYYGKKVIILLDEYDTPMQESYVNGYWEELAAFTRNLLNTAFKSNPYLERAIMTGITRVSRESIFSDLNNLNAVTSVSTEYSDCFGFTEDEVQNALKEYGLENKMSDVKQWYDGFTFGTRSDIYNPWSIINFLANGRVGPYWTNTSSNSLAGNLIREGNIEIKESFETLLSGGSIETEIDEQIVYDRLDIDENAVWSLLLASGYLSIVSDNRGRTGFADWKQNYRLKITNLEVMVMFRRLVKDWFSSSSSNYNEFITALLGNNLDAMNLYMNRISINTFSFFDSGKHPSSESEPERIYHGFILGLIVDLEDRYIITSNRESGFGRYDVLLEPKNPDYSAYILEFKVQSPGEPNLEATVQAALDQIRSKSYHTVLTSHGIRMDRIYSYGFAFCGKTILIGGGKLTE